MKQIPTIKHSNEVFYVRQARIIQGVQGGRRGREYHRRRVGPFYLPVRGEPVDQAARGRAADAPVRTQFPRRDAHAGRQDANKRLFLGENARNFYGFTDLPVLPYIKNMSE